MKKVYLITGAAGHVGSALCMRLKERGEAMRALCMRGEDTTLVRQLGAEVFFGDVTQPETMRDFFTLPEDCEGILLHCAGVVEIADKHSPLAEKVNVEGTRNVMALAKEYGVSRIVYVCSVHSMPDLPQNMIKTEIDDYDPGRVEGGYAKSKAQAAKEVLALVKEGLPAVVVLPSGIIGPYSGKGNHLVQFVKNYANGKFPACVKGGYDFVDVRDVADGILAAAEHGKIGESYILSGGYHSLKELLDTLRSVTHGKRVITVPHFLAMAAAPFAVALAKRKKQKPLFSPYALKVILENGNYSHEKATQELGYNPRSLEETLSDTVDWLKETGEIKEKRTGMRRSRKKVHA